MGVSRDIVDSLLNDLRIEYSDREARAVRDLTRRAPNYDEAVLDTVSSVFAPIYEDYSIVLSMAAWDTGTLYNMVFTEPNDKMVVYEKYRVDAIELEGRSDIPKARITLYEDSEEVSTKQNVHKPNVSQQKYDIDVSVVRAYSGDKANRGELILLDYCDKVKEWLKTVDASNVSNAYILSLSYGGSTRPIRNPKYVTRTINCSAYRDIYLTQT